jgi:hypothetical protein
MYTVQCWLTGELRIYLMGFWNRKIGPKSGKKSQKIGRGSDERRAFTMQVLSTVSTYAKGTVR